MATGDTRINSSTSFATTAGFNTIVGATSGSAYVNSEDSNILIGANIAGTASESNVLRIGSGTGTGDSQINKAIVCGIDGINVTGTAVLISSSNQLGILISSQRFKENIMHMDDYSTRILSLRPVTFTYTVGDDRSQQSGLIAEEVASIMPELVVRNEQGDPQSVKYHDLPALLLNELQKAITCINDLKARVVALELR